MNQDEQDKHILNIMAKYDTIRTLDLETCENFRQFYRDNPEQLHHAIDRTGPMGAQDALHMIAASTDGCDTVRRAMSVISPPDDPWGQPELF